MDRREIAKQALAYIDHQYLVLKDLREVAHAVGYSYSYVSHVFREEIGISLQTYYTKKKIKEAEQRLGNHRQTVTRVAEELQYCSIHSFSKAFKRYTGLTPTEFQQRHSRSQAVI